MWQDLLKKDLRKKELPEKDSHMAQENSKRAALANTP
jgi:hypothetical protein